MMNYGKTLEKERWLEGATHFSRKSKASNKNSQERIDRDKPNIHFLLMIGWWKLKVLMKLLQMPTCKKIEHFPWKRAMAPKILKS